MADEGKASAAVPGRPPRLTHEELGRAQDQTLEAPRRRYGIAARILFRSLDMVYGKPLTLSRFKVLELIARVPYMAWEQVAFIAITHVMLIIEELIARSGRRQPPIMFFWLPQAIAFVYCQLPWLLFVVNPSWAYRLNVDFEDHAEPEYMTMVAENPEWDSASFESSFTGDFGKFASLADVFRQIGHDERVHKLESEAQMKKPRFR
jgi:ubiquinol oxidase